jgi:hypothetical protein
MAVYAFQNNVINFYLAFCVLQSLLMDFSLPEISWNFYPYIFIYFLKLASECLPSIRQDARLWLQNLMRGLWLHLKFARHQILLRLLSKKERLKY